MFVNSRNPVAPQYNRSIDPTNPRGDGVHIKFNRVTKEINVIADRKEQLKPYMAHWKKHHSFAIYNITDKKFELVTSSQAKVRWRLREL